MTWATCADLRVSNAILRLGLSNFSNQEQFLALALEIWLTTPTAVPIEEQ